MRSLSRVILILGLLLVLPTLAYAQTPVDGTKGVAFSDVDATATNPDGSPVIASYALNFIPGTGCAAVASIALGKPAADASGTIVVKPIPAFGTLPANCPYTLTITATGPGGSGVSPATDPFERFVDKVPTNPSKPVIQ